MQIKIKNLTFKCIIGILPFEREKKQSVIINCKIKYNYKKNNFIDYSKITQDIENIMKKREFELIEDAILELRRHIFDTYKIKKLKLSICKPHIINNCEVSVSK
ncbi:dihydroneopterin aldolase [Arcobacter sp. CECT 8986]|uniref:dihydroneopterin aldolase n=1 Tax=Arcobacter sp. CECT 8986 TaxID=2044507 RepID=UPI0010098D49|nr:dihydroneopterin aldolase [Arcobacter sp. CECT 8986]RXJ99309.1 dihydroneopterin aldolase [Arcobacter sp. CECT 8986]